MTGRNTENIHLPSPQSPAMAINRIKQELKIQGFIGISMNAVIIQVMAALRVHLGLARIKLTS